MSQALAAGAVAFSAAIFLVALGFGFTPGGWRGWCAALTFHADATSTTFA